MYGWSASLSIISSLSFYPYFIYPSIQSSTQTHIYLPIDVSKLSITFL